MEPHYPAPGAVEEEEPQVEPHYPAPGAVDEEELTKEEPPHLAQERISKETPSRASCPPPCKDAPIGGSVVLPSPGNPLI